MSFSGEAKSEICKIIPQNFCCKKAECYGMLLFTRNFLHEGLLLTTENSLVAHLSAELTAQVTGAMVDVTTVLSHRGGQNRAFSVRVSQREDSQKILKTFGHEHQEISLRMNFSNLEDEPCYAAFLRGVFLSCGTVIDPEKDYHLEFMVPYMNLAKDLISLISSIEALSIQPSLINRKGVFVVYIKGSEQIVDFLTYIGACGAAMQLMQVKMLKEVRNNVNRKINFETANLGKTANAAARQITAIEKIRDTVGLNSLPEELQELAELRLENPEMSLRELGENLSEPISRSGVNHRLQRLLEFAASIQKK